MPGIGPLRPVPGTPPTIAPLIYGTPNCGMLVSSWCMYAKVSRVGVPMPNVTEGAMPQRLFFSTSRPGMSLRWNIALRRTATVSLTCWLMSAVAR